MERNEVLALVDHIYEARVRGDREALAAMWAEGATYRMMGDAEFIGEHVTQPCDARETVGELMANFDFHATDRIDELVEGNRVAATLRVVVAPKGGEPRETHMLSIWTFDECGKATSLVEFVDTALVMTTMAAGGPA